MRNNIRLAYERGRDSALSLRVGDQFTGAFGAADGAGYAGRSLDRALFICGFLEHLPRPVRSTWDNVITELGD